MRLHQAPSFLSAGSHQSEGSLSLTQSPESHTPSFSKTRQPALISDDCSTSPVKTEKVFQPKFERASISLPFSSLSGAIRSTSPEMQNTLTGATKSSSPRPRRRQRTQSPTSSYDSAIGTPTMPPKVARDPRRKSAWLKARAQHARNRELQQYSEFEVLHVTLEPRPRPQRADSAVFGPKRKQAAFVKEEELKCFREDRAGTPHISELQPDDEVIAPLTVEELGMGGEAEALATNLATDGDKMIDLHGI